MGENEVTVEITDEAKADVTAYLRDKITTSAQVVEPTVVTPIEPATPAVETTEVTTETTEVVDKPFFEELPDILKVSSEAVTTEETQVVVPDNIKAELDAKTAKLAELENHPIVQTILKYGELKDFDLTKLAQSYNTTDYGKMGAKELVAEKLKQDYPSLTPEQIEAEAENYLTHKGIDDNTSIVIKGEFEKQLRTELESRKSTPEYVKALEEAAKAIKPIDPQEQLTQVMQMFEGEKGELTSFVSQLKGQKVFGNELGDEHINKVVERFEYMFNPKSAPYTTADGKFDTKSFFLDTYKAMNYDADLKKAYEKGLADYVKSKANIDPMGSPTPSAPQEQGNKSVIETIIDRIEKRQQQ